MFTTTRYLFAAVSTAVLLTTTACASGTYYPQRVPIGDRDDRAYYDRGFRSGRQNGEEDARRGRAYDLRRHSEYRQNRRGDDRGDLVAYRRGFEAGYDEGYRAFNSRGSEGDRRYPRRTESPGTSGGPRARVFSTPAGENGYRDGLDAGRRAARDGRRPDPIVERRYREGDHDYNNRYGSRDEYKRLYRDAFQQGYADGFRDGRRP